MANDIKGKLIKPGARVRVDKRDGTVVIVTTDKTKLHDGRWVIVQFEDGKEEELSYFLEVI